jgi:hypothetical protein
MLSDSARDLAMCAMVEGPFLGTKSSCHTSGGVVFSALTKREKTSENAKKHRRSIWDDLRWAFFRCF